MSRPWRNSLSGDLSIACICQIAISIFTCQSPKQTFTVAKPSAKKLIVPK